jgi:hypothetical protein
MTRLRVAAGALAVLVAGAALALTHHPSSAGASVPRGFPQSVLIGMHDPEGGAAALRAEAPIGMRYHYLSGGVNTGAGWQTFSGGGGAFVGNYVADSQASGFMSWFSYYMLQQSTPGSAQTDERLRTTVNLASLPTMAAYYEDLKVFFQRAAATGVDPIVLHVEPDLWGYVQRSSIHDDASSVPAKVAATGLPELAGLPDNAAGFAEAIVRLRDQYAPNVLLAYPVSVWGTGVDIAISDPIDAEVDALSARTVAFYRSLGANFDLLAFEFADRDSGYREIVDHAGRQGWWNAADFRRNERYVGDVTRALQRSGVMWQIPLGNTRMLAMNNTTGHYQDNRVETLLDPSLTELKRYRDAGIVGLLFGNANAGTTCACDAVGDGVTNPPAINANLAASLSADDDGGFFKASAARYMADGALPAAPPPPAVTPPPPPPPSLWSRFSLRATVKPQRVRRGHVASVSARVTSSKTVKATVSIELRSPGSKSRRVRLRTWSQRAFVLGRLRPFALTWRAPQRAKTGRYAVVVRVVQRRGKASRVTKLTTKVVVRR